MRVFIPGAVQNVPFERQRGRVQVKEFKGPRTGSVNAEEIDPQEAEVYKMERFLVWTERE